MVERPIFERSGNNIRNRQRSPEDRYGDNDVRRVDENGEDRGYPRADDRIKEDIYQALLAHRNIDASDIEVAVTAGEVTLTGTVKDPRMKRLAEQCAEVCRSAKGVINQLRHCRPRIS